MVREPLAGADGSAGMGTGGSVGTGCGGPVGPVGPVGLVGEGLALASGVSRVADGSEPTVTAGEPRVAPGVGSSAAAAVGGRPTAYASVAASRTDRMPRAGTCDREVISHVHRLTGAPP